ncbi:hypothetical protein C8Q76DRAFT_802893 [Earliella scabrosa]|nr:hypothetical protein C8Q76DRAFT_802893 [Earliella scabrosa]
MGVGPVPRVHPETNSLRLIVDLDPDTGDEVEVGDIGLFVVTAARFFLFAYSDASSTSRVHGSSIALPPLTGAIQENQTGVKKKHFQIEQYPASGRSRSIHTVRRFYEALADLQSGLFALFSALDNVPNSLANQRQIVTGKDRGAQEQPRVHGAVYFVPNILGILLIKNKVGLYFTHGLIAGIGPRTSSSPCPHTRVTVGRMKRMATNASMLMAYRKPHAVGCSDVVCSLLMRCIRWLLWQGNKKCNAEPADKYDRVYIKVVLADGRSWTERRVDQECWAEFLLEGCTHVYFVRGNS